MQFDRHCASAGLRGVCLMLIVTSFAGWLGAVGAAPRFSIPGGVYTNDLKLELSAAPGGTVIRFTLDGSEPTLSSPIYSKALTITNSTRIRARAFEADMPSGAALSQTYILLDSTLLDFNSN